MAAKLQTEIFGSVPPFPRHAITTHMPGWNLMLRFIDRDPEIMTAFKSMYPRMMPHRDVKAVGNAYVRVRNN